MTTSSLVEEKNEGGTTTSEDEKLGEDGDEDGDDKKRKKQQQQQQNVNVLDDLQSHLSIAAKEFEDELQLKEVKPNWKASAVGGMMSLAQDFAVMAVTKNSNNNNSNNNKTNNSIWDKAIRAAQVSADIHEEERKFRADSDVSIEYLVGDITSSRNIGFVIHGFMTADEDEENVSDQWIEWSKTLDTVLYRIHWPAGSINDWKQFVNKSTVGNNNNNNNKKKQQQQLISTSSSGITLQNNKNSPNWISQLTSNPWNVAQDKTVHIGGVLAKFFERQPESLKKYSNVSLIGHSLGGAIVYQTLKQCTCTADSNNTIVDNAIILGGAFVIGNNSSSKKETITNLLKPIRKKFINVYSRNDQVLQIIYRAANVNLHHEAAGTIPMLIRNQIIDSEIRNKWLDLDVTSQIPVNEKTYQGHSYEYIIPSIAKTLKDVLA